MSNSQGVFIHYCGQWFCDDVPQDASDDEILNMAIPKFKQRTVELQDDTLEFDVDNDCRRFRRTFWTGNEYYEFYVTRGSRIRVCTRLICS